MIEPEAFKRFEEWFNREDVEDSGFAGETAQGVLDWAEKNGFLNEVLTLSETGGHLGELDSSLYDQCELGRFPSVRRIGGDHDRGFSPALNGEMRHRAHIKDGDH
jgi:hypothetical protein